MLSQLCGYLRNYFEREKVLGTFKIEDGVITLTSKGDFAPLPGQYIRVVGSYLSDGVYLWTGGPIECLADETFEGAVWLLAIPNEVVVLDNEINEWVTKYKDTLSSPFTSESLSGSSYSYSKGSGDSMASMTWQNAFKARLEQWRKI